MNHLEIEVPFKIRVISAQISKDRERLNFKASRWAMFSAMITHSLRALIAGFKYLIDGKASL